MTSLDVDVADIDELEIQKYRTDEEETDAKLFITPGSIFEMAIKSRSLTSALQILLHLSNIDNIF